MIWIILGHIITTRSLHDITGHKGSRVVVTLQTAIGQISLDLQTEQIPVPRRGEQGGLLFTLLIHSRAGGRGEREAAYLVYSSSNCAGSGV